MYIEERLLTFFLGRTEKGKPDRACRLLMFRVVTKLVIRQRLFGVRHVLDLQFS